MMRSLLLSAAVAVGLVAGPVAAEGLYNQAALQLPAENEAPAFPIRFADGRQGSLADYRGQVVVLTFWQTRCGFCHVEMPKLNDLAADMGGEGLVVAALSLDTSFDQISRYLNGRGLSSLAPVQDVDRVNGTFMSLTQHGTPMISTPTQYVIGKDGQIVEVVWGAGKWDTPERRSMLRSLMAQPSA